MYMSVFVLGKQSYAAERIGWSLILGIDQKM